MTHGLSVKDREWVARHDGRRLCRAEGCDHPAIFVYRGRVSADAAHDLCPRHWRSTIDEARRVRLQMALRPTSSRRTA
jgi:hypothetical protein